MKIMSNFRAYYTQYFQILQTFLKLSTCIFENIVIFAFVFSFAIIPMPRFWAIIRRTLHLKKRIYNMS